MRSPGIGLGLTAALLSALLAGCGRPSQVLAGATPTPSVRIASTPAWQEEGARLRDYKRQQNVSGTRSAGCGDSSSLPCNAADFAYPSVPVTITGPGSYAFQFGPLGPEFDPPRSPSAVAYSFPSDASFQLVPVGAPTIVSIGGQRFLEAKFNIISFQGAVYPNFYGWIY